MVHISIQISKKRKTTFSNANRLDDDSGSVSLCLRSASKIRINLNSFDSIHCRLQTVLSFYRAYYMLIIHFADFVSQGIFCWCFIALKILWQTTALKLTWTGKINFILVSTGSSWRIYDLELIHAYEGYTHDHPGASVLLVAILDRGWLIVRRWHLLTWNLGIWTQSSPFC